MKRRHLGIDGFSFIILRRKNQTLTLALLDFLKKLHSYRRSHDTVGLFKLGTILINCIGNYARVVKVIRLRGIRIGRCHNSLTSV